MGNGQHTEALVVEAVYGLENVAADLVGQRLHATVTLCKGADGEHFFHSALRHHLGLPCLVLYHRGQPTACEVKGNFIYLYIVFRQVHQPRVLRLGLLGLVDDGQVHQVLIAGLEIAVEIGVAQDPGVILAVDVQVIFQHHLILSQGPGLIGTQDIHSSEVLNGVEIFHNGLLLAHGHRPLGQAGGDDHGQHLWGQTHGDGDAEQKGIQPVPFGDAVDEEYQGDHNEHKADEHPGDGVYSLSEAGLYRLACHGGGHGAKQGVVTYADGHSGGAAGDHIAAHESDVGIIRDALCGVTHMRGLFHRLALTGETGLTDKQVFGLQNTHICGNHIAGGQMHDVPHHKIIHGNLHLFLSPAGDGAGGGDHGQKLLRCVAAPGFLYKPKGTGNQHHGENNHHRQTIEILRCAAQQGEIGEDHIGQGGYQGQAEQNGGEGIDESASQPFG